MEELIEIVTNILSGNIVGLVALLTTLLSIFVEISPIKFNPITVFLQWIGKKVNGELIKKVDDLESTVTSIQMDNAERNAIECRVRILRFGDEICHDVQHSNEHFDQVLEDIDTYEKYCRDHPDFKNNKTRLTTAKILDTYAKCIEDNNFL